MSGLDDDPLNDVCDSCGAAVAVDCPPSCTGRGLTLDALRRNSWGGPYRDRSWQGYSLHDTALQSHLCHPTWSASTHRIYLVAEEPFDPAVVFVAPIEQWLEEWRTR